MKSVEKINKELNEIVDIGIGSLILDCFVKCFNDYYEDFQKSEYYKGENVDEEFQNYLSSHSKKDS